MTKLYPTLIIPPIPSKQTIGDYAVKQGKAKEDVAMIARRKRMLQTFLNRLARHPILSNEHVFHRFLEGEVSWVRILSTRRSVPCSFYRFQKALEPHTDNNWHDNRPKFSIHRPSHSFQRTSLKHLLTIPRTPMRRPLTLRFRARRRHTHFEDLTSGS